MSYRVRYTTKDGKTGYWKGVFGSEEVAKMASDATRPLTGHTYTVEEIHDASGHGSTAADHVESLRAQVNDLEAVQKAMHRDLTFALQIGDAMREAMRHGAWGHDGEGHLASVSAGAWDRWKTSLAKAPSVPVGASEAPGEGGDSDRRRLEALERWLRGDTYRLVYFSTRQLIVATSDLVNEDGAEAHTLAALADKLAAKEAKP